MLGLDARVIWGNLNRNGWLEISTPILFITRHVVTATLLPNMLSKVFLFCTALNTHISLFPFIFLIKLALQIVDMPSILFTIFNICFSFSA